MKGHVFLVQNSDTDYVRQACALALSIKKHNTISNTCIVTNDPIPAEYRHAFDHVVNIPWTDLASSSQWKVENRWKIIHATPFKENIVYDVDMILLNSNDHWWQRFENRDLCFTTSVTDYRGNIVTNDFYRKAFTENNLVDVYTGCFYFKRNNRAFEFFKWLELITANWEDFYEKFLPKKSQKFVSIDLSAALALKFMNLEETAKVNLMPSFIHMKPMIQDWGTFPSKWTDVLTVNFTDNCELKLADIRQQGLFHYVEDEFLTDDILGKLLKNV